MLTHLDTFSAEWYSSQMLNICCAVLCCAVPGIPACLLACLQFQEEEREKNEANLMTLVSDSISAMVFFIMFVRDTDAREALFSTIGRLFEGLSDIAKAVLIILVADTLLGYHSEEGVCGRHLFGNELEAHKGALAAGLYA